MILWGDLNEVVNTGLHRSRVFFSVLGISSLFLESIQSLGLKDIWREKHATQKDYTFYSYPHGSYTRLDDIWLSTTLCEQILSSDIRLRLQSMHLFPQFGK